MELCRDFWRTVAVCAWLLYDNICIQCCAASSSRDCQQSDLLSVCPSWSPRSCAVLAGHYRPSVALSRPAWLAILSQLHINCLASALQAVRTVFDGLTTIFANTYMDLVPGHQFIGLNPVTLIDTCEAIAKDTKHSASSSEKHIISSQRRATK